MEHRIGPQTLDINGDTAVITLDGDFLAEHTRPLLALLDGMGGGTGKLYILADVRRLSSVHPEARRIAGAWQGVSRAQCTAIIGANLVARTLVMLVARASALMSNTPRGGEIRFFNTEAEARDWVVACGAAFASR